MPRSESVPADTSFGKRLLADPAACLGAARLAIQLDRSHLAHWPRARRAPHVSHAHPHGKSYA